MSGFLSLVAPAATSLVVYLQRIPGQEALLYPSSLILVSSLFCVCFCGFTCLCFWLRWAFLSLPGALRGGCSSCGAQASGYCRVCSCEAQALGCVSFRSCAPRLEHRPCSCGPGSNSCLPHWQADSSPLSHQGSLCVCFVLLLAVCSSIIRICILSLVFLPHQDVSCMGAGVCCQWPSQLG